MPVAELDDRPLTLDPLAFAVAWLEFHDAIEF